MLVSCLWSGLTFDQKCWSHRALHSKILFMIIIYTILIFHINLEARKNVEFWKRKHNHQWQKQIQSQKEFFLDQFKPDRIQQSQGQEQHRITHLHVTKKQKTIKSLACQKKLKSVNWEREREPSLPGTEKEVIVQPRLVTRSCMVPLLSSKISGFWFWSAIEEREYVKIVIQFCLLSQLCHTLSIYRIN